MGTAVEVCEITATVTPNSPIDTAAERSSGAPTSASLTAADTSSSEDRVIATPFCGV
jgi:hypothetical protein